MLDLKLCTSCGACAGVCPTNAISMVRDSVSHKPSIDKDMCVGCGRCQEVCPGPGFDYEYYHKQIFGSIPNHKLGHYINVYAGHTTDAQILSSSQSGGFVSTLLCSLLEQGIIQGAIVSARLPNAPLEPVSFVARTRTTILSAVGSIYNSVPTAELIKNLLQLPGKYVFVGLPCHIHAMRKAEQLYPQLKNAIQCYIGLHCLGVFTYSIYDRIFSMCGLSQKDIKEFRHKDKRSGMQHGGAYIVDNNDNVHLIDPYKSRLHKREQYTNPRCLVCIDKTNQFCDISCGDCRMPRAHAEFKRENYDPNDGLSEIVVRTPRGQNTIDRLRNFLYKTYTADEVLKSIYGGINKIDRFEEWCDLLDMYPLYTNKDN
jgi:coenzyme F420 hydrogenase subunit beta